VTDVILTARPREAHTDYVTFHCDECFDTETIDRNGAEIPCPFCAVAHYHPSAVTVVREGAKWWVIDRSQDPAGARQGFTDPAEAQHRATRRKAVIKAALTRRANKAAK
jgi:hypothetical protein